MVWRRHAGSVVHPSQCQAADGAAGGRGHRPYRCGVESRLFLLGRVPDVAAWLGRAAVLVHPARWEGFGLGVLEAMLAGLPVVATNVSALPELVVDHETGVLVRPDDAHALANGIVRALDQPQLGRRGLERARQEFSVGRMADRTAALYPSSRLRREHCNTAGFCDPVAGKGDLGKCWVTRRARY